MKVEIEMPEQRIQDLLCNALEGGSNYWYCIEEYHFPNKCPYCNVVTMDEHCSPCKENAIMRGDPLPTGKYSGIVPTEKQTKESLGIEFVHIELPFKGGFIEFSDLEDEEAEHKNLTMEAIQRGVKVMAEKYPKHFGDWIGENDDVITGDVFLQCCLFGEVIYG